MILVGKSVLRKNFAYLASFSTAFLIQVAGILSLAVVSMIVADRFGVEGQSFYASARSLIDFGVSIAVFGLPQSISYLATKRSTLIRPIVKCSVAYAFAVAPMVWVLIKWAAASRISIATPFQGWAPAILAFAVANLTASGLIRGAVLATSSSVRFSSVSAAYQFAQLAIFFLWPYSSPATLLYALAAAALISTAFNLKAVSRAFFSCPTGKRLKTKDLRQLFVFGWWSFVPAVAMNLLPVITFEALKTNCGPSAVGLFSISVIFLNMFAAPLNIMMPILYRRWVDSPLAEETKQELRSLTKAAFWCAIPAIIVISLAAPALTIFFYGEQFAPSIGSTKTLIYGSVFIVLSRIFSAMLTALGSPDIVAISQVTRTLITSAFLFLIPNLTLELAAVAWIIGEFIAALQMGLMVSKRTSVSPLRFIY